MARHGCRGGMVSAMDAIRNNVPRTSRSAAVCGGKEEATTATMMEAMMAAGMSLYWQLQEQAWVGAMRVGGGRWRTQ
jgi:hypothetical protein